MFAEQTSAVIMGSTHTHQHRADVHRYALFPAIFSAVNLQRNSNGIACLVGNLHSDLQAESISNSVSSQNHYSPNTALS